MDGTGVDVGRSVAVGVFVAVGVRVGVAVLVGVGVGSAVSVAATQVASWASAAAFVAVAFGVAVGTAVGVLDGAGVTVEDGVAVGLALGVADGVAVRIAVGVRVGTGGGVLVETDVAVRVAAGTGVFDGAIVGVLPGVLVAVGDGSAVCVSVGRTGSVSCTISLGSTVAIAVGESSPAPGAASACVVASPAAPSVVGVTMRKVAAGVASSTSESVGSVPDESAGSAMGSGEDGGVLDGAEAVGVASTIPTGRVAVGNAASGRKLASMAVTTASNRSDCVLSITDPTRNCRSLASTAVRFTSTGRPSHAASRVWVNAGMAPTCVCPAVPVGVSPTYGRFGSCMNASIRSSSVGGERPGGSTLPSTKNRAIWSTASKVVWVVSPSWVWLRFQLAGTSTW